MSRDLLLIAAKAPLPGLTKTRLGATIGMERAAALYSAFLLDLAARFTPGAAARQDFAFGWAYTPAELDFAAVLVEIGCSQPARAVHFVPQVGEGWDVRQANLLRWGFEYGYERTILTASDSPQMPRATVSQAFAALATNEVVLGRTHDGGYYLIGMRGYHEILTGVPMSTVTAAESLLARAAALGLRVAAVGDTFDVDEIYDLRSLYAALSPNGQTAPATWAALHRLGLAPVPDEESA